jgi:prepilin-type N-terminal cleavage/methylation domain-containing protein
MCKGLTLIELLVGVVLLGFAAVGVLTCGTTQTPQSHVVTCYGMGSDSTTYIVSSYYFTDGGVLIYRDEQQNQHAIKGNCRVD